MKNNILIKKIFEILFSKTIIFKMFHTGIYNESLGIFKSVFFLLYFS